MNNEIEYSVGWFTLALINAGLAQSKHRSHVWWFFVSLLIGPIATLLIVFFCNGNRKNELSEFKE